MTIGTANVTPYGDEFLVNTTTLSDQSGSSTVALANGMFVVSWTDESAGGGDYSSYAVRAQMFYADGSAFGSEFLVNTTTTDAQHGPDIAALADGGFIITWTDESTTGGDTSGFAVRAQMYNADGSVNGSEFLVNSTTSNSQWGAAVTGLDGGGFVVTWQDLSQTGTDTNLHAVRAQVFDARGDAVNGEFVVNTSTTGTQTIPNITSLDSGGFFISWQDHEPQLDDNSSVAVRGQIYAANGNTVGGEFLVNTTTNGFQLKPAASELANGRFVVVWESHDQSGGDTDSASIRGQVFNANGSKFGSEFLVNTTTADGQRGPSVTTLADGRFVVAWDDYSDSADDTSGAAVRAQVFDADGSKSGTEFLVNTSTNGLQYHVDLTALEDGRFLATWTDLSTETGDTKGSAINGQIFDPREAGITLTGTDEADSYVGSGFIDSISGGDGRDIIEGGNRNDTLKGQKGNDTLYGDGGRDTLLGGNGKDKLYGGNGADTLVGGAGADKLRGNDGADMLTGGAAKDTLFGGAGADTFIYNNASDSTNSAKADIIKDFEIGTDHIDLSAFSGLSFIGTTGFSGAAEVRAVVNGAGDTLVRVDVDGDGSADMKIILSGVSGITADDFIL